MISIRSNMPAMNAMNQFQINSLRSKKTTAKLSSGYKINTAADDAAGLSISEKMRRQIRGLTQGAANAQNGISFMQVADGSMEEIHSMLQRMNELSVQSLNGAYTDSDRAALDAEFRQLRTEIDRISQDTLYNDQPVFEEHENSYYQLAGNKRWDYKQRHTISSMANEMNIHLPDNYVPNDFTLTVPAGVYTTQELIDEIDSALERMQPPNPGFTFEYTKDGFCRMNFENADGIPVAIDSVGGSLSYLLYDSYQGSSSSSLLGTTVFDARYPLDIVKDQNDGLGFYVEGPGGAKPISMTIPQGKYSRAQMIDFINSELSKNSDAAGVFAKEYGDSGIQITGGSSISITGLKGNMFKFESSGAVYSSVFYDNINYGYSTGGTQASITGQAYYVYYDDSVTDKIHLSASQNNNVLRFKVNGAADYTEIKFEDGDYTIDQIKTTINDKLKTENLEDKAQADIGYTSVRVPHTTAPDNNIYYTAHYLTLSSLVRGSQSTLEFDQTAGTVYANTYDALFRRTEYKPRTMSGNKAYLTGYANLGGAITLDNSPLAFHVDNTAYTINFDSINKNPANRDALLKDLNDYIQADASFTGLRETDGTCKIKFVSNGYGGISIQSQSDDIKRIEFTASDQSGDNQASYEKLFVGTATVANTPSYDYKYGSVSQPQGSTTKTIINAETWTSISDRQVTVDESSNIFEFYLEGYRSVKLSSGTYGSMGDLAAEMNSQFAKSGDAMIRNTKASYEGGLLKLTFTPPADSFTGSYYLRHDTGGSIWRAVLGTHPQTTAPTITEASRCYLWTSRAIDDTIAIDGSNNQMTLTLGSGSSAVSSTLTISGGSYDRESLKNALQAAIDANADLGGKNIEVMITNEGKLQFSAYQSLKAEGSLYHSALVTDEIKDASSSNGSYTSGAFERAFIIGRKDLTAKPIEIVENSNDKFIFDFTYPDPASATGSSITKEFEIKIAPNTYTGNQIAALLQDEMQAAFKDEGIDNFKINVSIGGIQTHVVGSNDDTALQIVLNRDTSVANNEPPQGNYIIDGIRGSAAGFLFYKTTDNPTATYITGTKYLAGGITFQPGRNVLTLSADSVPLQYTFQENKHYTADEFTALLNDMFQNGDDNGIVAPLKASIENGNLKISHKVIGSHTITDVGGSAKGALFLQESSRAYKAPIYLLVGAETKDMVKIPRTRVGSCALSINSITISKTKYAEKALRRIKDAITQVSSKRSNYGTMQNRLEHTINNDNNIVENTQASESAIRDADIAKEAMDHARNNIIMQANQSMLAQANQQPNLVLSLLQ